MKLFCALICVFSHFVNEVDSRPEKLSYQEGSISTRDVRIKVDENMAELQQRLSNLGSNFSEVTDAKIELKSRFDPFEKEMSMLSQGTYLEAIGVCLGRDTIPRFNAPCLRNPMSYITDKFTYLYQRIGEFEVENLSRLSKAKDLNKAKENVSTDHLSNLEGHITVHDVKKKLYEIVTKILTKEMIRKMEMSLVINPDFEERVNRRLQSFKTEILWRFEWTYDGAMRLCAGSDNNSVNTAPCYRNPMDYLAEKVTSLNRTVDKFDVEMILYLGEEEILKEDNWNPEKLLNQEVINITDEDIISSYLWFLNLQFKFLGSVKAEYRVEFKRKFDSFEEEMMKPSKAIQNGEVRFCEESDSSPGDEAPCYRNQTDYLKEQFTLLYKRSREFEEECRLFKRALED